MRVRCVGPEKHLKQWVLCRSAKGWVISLFMYFRTACVIFIFSESIKIGLINISAHMCAHVHTHTQLSSVQSIHKEQLAWHTDCCFSCLRMFPRSAGITAEKIPVEKKDSKLFRANFRKVHLLIWESRRERPTCLLVFTSYAVFDEP